MLGSEALGLAVQLTRIPKGETAVAFTVAGGSGLEAWLAETKHPAMINIARRQIIGFFINNAVFISKNLAISSAARSAALLDIEITARKYRPKQPLHDHLKRNC